MRLRLTVERGIILCLLVVVLLLKRDKLRPDLTENRTELELINRQIGVIQQTVRLHQNLDNSKLKDGMSEQKGTEEKGNDADEVKKEGSEDFEEREDEKEPKNEHEEDYVAALPAALASPNPMTQENLTVVQEIADSRRRHMTEECERRGLQNNGFPRITSHILVSDKFRALYCMVGKVASSTWKKVFLLAAGRIKSGRADEFQHKQVGARALKVLRPITSRKNPRNEERVKSYFKFLFVRHPFDRIVSTFLEKFRLGWYGETYGRRIIRRYRLNATAESLQRGHDVTLEEFVRFMIDQGRFRHNVHWTPQYDLCMPCSMPYDFIGHYETLWTDGDYVLSKLGVANTVSFPRWSKNRTTGEHYEEMFKKVRPEYVRKLKQFYANDFAFFGYS